VTFDYDRNKGAGTLRWKPNPTGRAPAKYRVYASDEKGFSISDEPYKVNVGVSKDVGSQFPANFVAETAAVELAVLGAEVALPGANKSFYRVVAVDGQGKRSGPSDYAEAPRPLIVSKPVTTAKVGAEYRCQVSTLRSLGDLRTRVVGGREVCSFWDIEKPKYAIQRGPKWLGINEATGMLSGIADAAGKADVTVVVTLEREVRKLDEGALKWGNEKVVSTTTEKVGDAAQEFAIDIGQ
jgi:hypothetical protein